MAEGTLPGFGSLTEYQKQTALGNVRTIEAQERAAAEEAKKKQKEQQEQQATSPQPKFSFQQQMTEQEYGSGVSVLQGLGMWQ
ncbi:hypothetical protein EBR03_04335 [bacterium]|nr:hypothetical protein [bacterium]